MKRTAMRPLPPGAGTHWRGLLGPALLGCASSGQDNSAPKKQRVISSARVTKTAKGLLECLSLMRLRHWSWSCGPRDACSSALSGLADAHRSLFAADHPGRHDGKYGRSGCCYNGMNPGQQGQQPLVSHLVPQQERAKKLNQRRASCSDGGHVCRGLYADEGLTQMFPA